MSNQLSPERVNFLQEVFITALEGGIGYWSFCKDYDPDNITVRIVDFEDVHREADDEDYDAFGAIKDPTSEVFDRHAIAVDRHTIQRGVLAIINDNEHKIVNSEIRDIVLFASRTNESCPDEGPGDIDAGIADVIVQVGLFGGVSYA